MKALVFGEPPTADQPRPAADDEVDALLASIPFGLHTLEDARPIRPDWVVTRPRLSGICGSDSKLVLGEFSEGDMDNPMSAFSSLPHVPGHEVVAEVVELGPEASGVEEGQRVVINPWLTCRPRGVTPLCPPCQAGDLSLCWSFTTDNLGPGLHLGVCTKAPGAWAELMAAHDSMAIPVPDEISDEAAVLADPFAVAFHAVHRHPPHPGSKVLVWGAGALGLASVAILRAFHPDVEVAVVARFPAQRETARRFGASMVVGHEPREAVLEELARWSGGVLHVPFMGLPMAHPGGVDVVYDTVAKPETFEVAVRVLADRGRLVYTGVATPGRWEWTPIYFKELTLIGSNAFGIEEVDGVRKHAIAHYLDFVADGRIDITPMLTHRFTLDQWPAALGSIARADTTGALKVAFTPNP